MKKIELNFEGFWREEKKKLMPDESGVYCVYRCVYNSDENTVTIKELFYIGESENVNERIANHDRLEDWKGALQAGETLCYSCAKVDEKDRERAEAAMIFKDQPPFNDEHKNGFDYEDTHIIIKGRKSLLSNDYVVHKGDRK